MLRFLPALLAAILLNACQSRANGQRNAPDAGLYAPLRPFYAALADLQAGRRSRVAVLQIGDSHTANDGFSGRMRELMQARFGDGGRGLLPPGIPYRYYKPATVAVVADGWRAEPSGADAGPFGFAGLRQVADGQATTAITASPPELDRLFIDVIGQPGGGTLDITTSDGRATRVSTASAGRSMLRVQALSGQDTSSVQMRARGDGPVTWMSWTAETGRAGVTWSNLGTIGAQVTLLANWDAGVMAAEAKHLQPSLIVLAFGTNEGFSDATDLVSYPAHFRAALAALHRAAPMAAVMIAGPLGGVRAAPSGPGEPCAGEAGLRWSVPANLPKVRGIERAVAQSDHLFFWDWAAAMGGDCAIVPWAETDPPLAAHDHVHLLKPGYRQTAEALFDTLMRGYDSYRESAARR